MNSTDLKCSGRLQSWDGMFKSYCLKKKIFNSGVKEMLDFVIFHLLKSNATARKIEPRNNLHIMVKKTPNNNNNNRELFFTGKLF